MAIVKLFKNSLYELKDVRCLTVTGILIALYVIIETLSLDLGFLKINFAFIALALIGMLYGPSVALLAAIPCDLLGAMMKGNSIMFIFTLIAMFEGLIYGLFLYRYDPFNKRSFRNNMRIVIAQTIVVFISHVVLNSLALLLIGYYADIATFWTSFSTRLVKNLIEYPIDLVLLFMILLPATTAYRKILGGKLT